MYCNHTCFYSIDKKNQIFYFNNHLYIFIYFFSYGKTKREIATSVNDITKVYYSFSAFYRCLAYAIRFPSKGPT